MASTSEQLRGLFSVGQLAALDTVSAELKHNPSALDTKTKKEKEDGNQKVG